MPHPGQLALLKKELTDFGRAIGEEARKEVLRDCRAVFDAPVVQAFAGLYPLDMRRAALLAFVDAVNRLDQGRERAVGEALLATREGFSRLSVDGRKREILASDGVTFDNYRVDRPRVLDKIARYLLSRGQIRLIDAIKDLTCLVADSKDWYHCGIALSLLHEIESRGKLVLGLHNPHRDFDALCEAIYSSYIRLVQSADHCFWNEESPSYDEIKRYLPRTLQQLACLCLENIFATTHTFGFNRRALYSFDFSRTLHANRAETETAASHFHHWLKNQQPPFILAFQHSWILANQMEPYLTEHHPSASTIDDIESATDYIVSMMTAYFGSSCRNHPLDNDSLRAIVEEKLWALEDWDVEESF